MKNRMADILKQKLQATEVEVRDLSAQHSGHSEAKKSGGGHYEVTVVSKLFMGKSRLERHRMVYEAVLGAGPSEIHALAIKAYAPGEWLKH